MDLPVRTWTDRIIRAGFTLLFCLVPLLLTPWNYELFEYNKMMSVYILTAAITSAWLIRSVNEKQLRIARTPFDIPLALFVMSQLVSAVFSMDPHVSWFGYYSRFNGGMWSVISYYLLYYAFVSNASLFTDQRVNGKDAIPVIANDKSKPKADTGQSSSSPIPQIRFLLTSALICSFVVAVYGILERLGIDKHLWVQDVQNRVFSTLGQPNWLAAYLVALFPVSLAYGFIIGDQQGKTYRQYVWWALGITLFVVLLFTRSRSGLLGFAVADAVFLGALFGRSFRWLKLLKKRPEWKPLIIIHAIFLLIVFVNGTGNPRIDRYATFAGWKNAVSPTRQAARTSETKPVAPAGPALEVGGTESGTIRKYVWAAAISAWRSSPKTMLIGTGTETFAFAFYRFRPAGHNMTSEWDFLYNKAHNEYLNFLATTGIFGLGSYLVFIGTCIVWFIRTWVHTKRHDPVLMALFAGWVSILVTNFFGFSVVILQVMLFLFPAMIVILSGSGRSHMNVPLSNTDGFFTKFPPALRYRMSAILRATAYVGGASVIFGICGFWYADTLYAKGYRLSRAGLYGQAVPALADALSINRTEPIYHDELASAYATLAVAAYEGGNATQAAQLAALSVDENAAALRTSPGNVNFHKTKTKIYYTLSNINPTFNSKATEALEAAIPLSPNDPKIYYNLAILVGRDGDSTKAIEYLKKSKTLKPNYRDVYYALWVFYTDAKDTANAKGILSEYLTTVDPTDKDFLERLK